jgi:hypothetical protein
MRLTLKFFALLLLLAIVTFPNSGSMTTMSDGGMVIEEEGGNPCFEGCVRGYDSCVSKCGLNMSCRQKCEDERMKCHAGCKPLAD